MLKKLFRQQLDTVLPYIYIIGSSVGLFAAFVLTNEKIALLEDPAHRLSCSLNPVVACGSVITSNQATAFGFPNPYIGLAGFAVVMTVGMALLAKARFQRWFWIGLNLGALFGISFVMWLAYQSIYVIGALCIYCMAVWAITAPIFWYTTLYNFRKKHIKTPKSLKGVVDFCQHHHGEILTLWYLAIFIAILTHFWYYWSTLL